MTPIRLERERRLFARSGIDVPSQTAGRLQLGRALVLRRVPALAAIAVGVLVSSLSLPTQADADDGKVKVNVVVDGLNADMKRNVLSSLELATATRSGALPAGEVYRLANRAPQQIELALQPFGYYRPVIRDAMQTDGGTWTARYSIEPGPPVVLSAVDVEISGPGKDLPGFTQAIRQFSLKPGGRLEHAPYEALKLSLSKAAASNGFLDARYPVRRLEVDRTANTGQVIVHFETGPRYFFGPVRFEQDMLDSYWFTVSSRSRSGSRSTPTACCCCKTI